MHEMEDDADKAEAFAAQYGSVYVDELCVPPSIASQCSSTLDNVAVTVKDVEALLSSTNPNKSPGPDGIHPLILKELAGTIAPALTRVFTVSLETGCLPLN